MSRAVVIGAGMGGLSAAIELASRGIEVTILEARDAPGGKVGVAHYEDVEFDTGPSVLTLPMVFDEVFGAAGSSLADEITLRSPSPAFRYLYPDGTRLDVHHHLEDTLDALRDALGSRARSELEAFLRYAERIWSASADTFVFGAAPSWTSVLKFGLKGVRQLRDIDAARSMARAIDQRVSDPHLRNLLLRYATYNGSNPFRAPATLNCIVHVEMSLGGFGVQGGMQELVRALVRVAQRAGAELALGTAVSEILLEGNQACGIRTNSGTTLRADAIIANADPEHVFRHLLPDKVGQKLRPDVSASTSGWTGILKARRRDDRAPHTVLFPPDYSEEFADLFDRDRPPQDPTVYLCDQSACHGRSGWSDGVPVFVMANAPAEPADRPRDAETWRVLEEYVRARLDAAGMATSDEPFIWRRTPAGLAEAFPGSRGALYGAASNSALSAFRRPPNRLARPRGLYLASGGAHPGGGMPLCASSGRAAARAVLKDLGLGP